MKFIQNPPSALHSIFYGEDQLNRLRDTATAQLNGKVKAASHNTARALHGIFGNAERMKRLQNTKRWHLAGEVLTFVCMDGGYDLTDEECKAVVDAVLVFFGDDMQALCRLVEAEIESLRNS